MDSIYQEIYQEGKSLETFLNHSFKTKTLIKFGINHQSNVGFDLSTQASRENLCIKNN